MKVTFVDQEIISRPVANPIYFFLIFQFLLFLSFIGWLLSKIRRKSLLPDVVEKSQSNHFSSFLLAEKMSSRG
jgi:hypothetical protein